MIDIYYLKENGPDIVYKNIIREKTKENIENVIKREAPALLLREHLHEIGFHLPKKLCKNWRKKLNPLSVELIDIYRNLKKIAEELEKRIISHQEKAECWKSQSLKEIAQKIINDETGEFAYLFCKESEKQNVSEEMDKLYFTAYTEDYKKLPQSGPEQITPLDGELYHGVIPNNKRTYSQNVDYIILRGENKSNKIYSSNKVIKGVGGFQNTQIACLEHYFKEATRYVKRHPTDEKTYFAIIVDGSYLLDKKGRKRLQSMKRKAKNPKLFGRIFVGSREEFCEGSFAKK